MVLANVLHCARRLLEGRKEKFDDEEVNQHFSAFLHVRLLQCWEGACVANVLHCARRVLERRKERFDNER